MDTSDVVKSKPVPFRLKFLHVVRLFIGTIARYISAWYYGTEGKKLPPIKEEILKLPTIEVARRIRQKEVSDAISFYSGFFDVVFECPFIP